MYHRIFSIIGYLLLVFLAQLPLILAICFFVFVLFTSDAVSFWIVFLLLLFILFSWTIFYKAAEFFKDEIKDLKTDLTLIFGNIQLDNKQKWYLQQYQTYYQSLNATHKKEFEKRVAHFLGRKQFVAKGELKQIDELQKVLIAACAIQLSFGIQALSFPRFKRIFLYQTSYYNPFTKRYHKGEATSKGRLIFSWEHFLEGYADNTDGINLGLHEMAHALRIENNTSGDGEYFFIPQNLWTDWDKKAMPVYYEIQKGSHDFLREYAGKNQEEFFAVCVEYFFEKPVEFESKLPPLYHSMCRLLNQNPARKIHRGY